MTEPLVPRDPHGSETLDTMSLAPRYHAWQVNVLRRWIGRRVIEIGAGVGNISAELRRLDPDLLVVTDVDPAYRASLRQRFGDDPSVRVEALGLPDPDVGSRFGPHRLDTAIALNVVEHIEDDYGTVRGMADAIEPGGRVIILVPALQAIYGAMDEALGHFRRYDKARLRSLLESADLDVEELAWFNRAGVPGWWWHGKVRRRATIPPGGARAFDSLVPILQHEWLLPLPFGQSVIGVGRKRTA